MSDYPRIMYHPDGHTAVAQSAHHERTDFADWSREASAAHRKDPGDGMVRTLQAVGVAPAPVPAPPRHQDAPGPVSAGDVRNIVQTAMDNHPGLNADLGGLLTRKDVEVMLDALRNDLVERLPVPTDATPPDYSGLAKAEDVQALRGDTDSLHEKLDLLLKNLGVEMPGDDEPVGDESAPRRRRGRPPGSANKLTGIAGEAQE